MFFTGRFLLRMFNATPIYKFYLRHAVPVTRAKDMTAITALFHYGFAAE
jgi:hypothetical protein